MAKGKTINHAELKEILGRAMTDPAFGKDLRADPKKALEGAGFHAHDDAVRFFKALGKKPFHDVAQHVHPKKGEHDPIEVAGEI